MGRGLCLEVLKGGSRLLELRPLAREFVLVPLDGETDGYSRCHRSNEREEITHDETYLLVAKRLGRVGESVFPFGIVVHMYIIMTMMGKPEVHVAIDAEAHDGYQHSVECKESIVALVKEVARHKDEVVDVEHQHHDHREEKAVEVGAPVDDFVVVAEEEGGTEDAEPSQELDHPLDVFCVNSFLHRAFVVGDRWSLVMRQVVFGYYS